MFLNMPRLLTPHSLFQLQASGPGAESLIPAPGTVSLHPSTKQHCPDVYQTVSSVRSGAGYSKWHL